MLKSKFLLLFHFICSLLVLISCNDRSLTGNTVISTKNTTPTLKGDWESSGGDGVLCQTAEGPKLSVLDSWEHLVQASAYKDGEFVSADLFFDQSKFRAYKFATYLNSNQILDLVLKKIWQVSPLFADKIYSIKKHIPFEKWNKDPNVIAIDDSLPKYSVPNNCKLVQIANRMTIKNPGKLPNTKIFFNPKLTKLLNPQQIAILQLHEYIYLYAKETGHYNSDSVRKLIAFLFSYEFFQMDSKFKGSSYKAWNFRQILDHPFGDYMRIFLKEKNSDPKNTNNLLYKGIIELMKKTRQQMNVCRHSFKNKNIDEQREYDQYRLCQKEVLNSLLIRKTLSPQASFVYITRFLHDGNNYDEDWHSEILMTPKKETIKAHGFDYEAILTKACDYINGPTMISNHTLQEKAKLFCREQGKHVTLHKEKQLKHYYRCNAGDAQLEGWSPNDFNLKMKLKGQPDYLFQGDYTFLDKETNYVWNNPFAIGMNSQSIFLKVFPATEDDYNFLIRILRGKHSLRYVKVKPNSPFEKDSFINLALSIEENKAKSVYLRMECRVTVEHDPTP